MGEQLIPQLGFGESDRAEHISLSTAKDINPPRWAFLRMVSKGERQLELPPRGRHKPEIRTCRHVAAGSSPVFKFLELAIKFYKLNVRSSGRELAACGSSLPLISWTELSLELLKLQCTAF